MSKPTPLDKIKTVARWRRRAEARPDEILDAALDQFLENGFDAARMEDVAKRAGLSKAGIYLYFNSKEALLQALILRAVQPIAQLFEAMAALPVAPSADALRTGLSMAYARGRDPRVFAVPHLVLSIANRYPDIVRFYRENVIDKAFAAIIRILERGMQEGHFRKIDPQSGAALLVGPIAITAMSWQIFGGPLGGRDPTLEAENHIDLILNGFAPRQNRAGGEEGDAA